MVCTIKRCYEAGMKIILSFILLLALCYLLLAIGMFVFQRSFLYFPVPYPSGVNCEEDVFTNQGIHLQGRN